MQLQIFTVDAFSERPLGGNPAAVVPLTQTIDDETMQKIAEEMNISETTYIQPLLPDRPNVEAEDWKNASKFSLRWFTPTCEVPLCGHATLATAHAIFDCLGNTNKELEFETMRGILKVKREESLLVMDFPAYMPSVVPGSNLETFTRIVNACTGNLRNKVKEFRYNPVVKYILVRLDDSVTQEDLSKMSPNFSEMASIHDGSLVYAMGVTVAGDTHRGGTFKYHAYSRFFATWLGVNEDPVCGSWHTVMGPYWAEQLNVKDLLFRQCSRRGGDIKVSILGGERVAIAGSAATVIKGHINI